MNKNTLTGFVLIAVVLIVFSWYGQKQAAEQQAAAQQEQMRLDSIAKANPAPKDTIDAAQLAAQQLKADSSRIFFTAMQEQQGEDIVLKNSKVELTLGTKGGIVKKAKVLGYKDYRGNADVTLFDERDQQLTFTLPANANKEYISTGDLYFQPSEVSDKGATLIAEGANGAKIVMRYSLGESYLMHFSIKTGQKIRPSDRLYLWKQK